MAQKLNSFTIRTLLLRGNVEPHPGPGPEAGKPTNLARNKFLDIVTFNCNGLVVDRKRRRVLLKVNDIINKGGIVMLQETHLTKDEQVLSTYKGGFKLNNHKSNSAGVATFFSNNFEILHNEDDDSGRMLLTVVKNENDNFLIANVYCPNDHKVSLNFVEKVYVRILEVLSDFPDCHVILGGDFNSCLTNKDYLNRNKTNAETELTNTIQQNNEICSLVDSYRHVNNDSGFSWNRGTCYSRLDYIFVSETLKSRIKSSSVNWSFEKSDHAAVITKIKLKEEIKKGPGIVKINMEILKNPIKVEQMRNEIVFLLNQIPLDWNGHMKLEFLKMSIRSTFAKFTSLVRNEDRIEIDNLELSLNDIEKLKQKILNNNNNLTSAELKNRFDKVEKLKVEMNNKLDLLRNNLDKKYELNTNAKWYEYGEKPNKFFLNLNKFRSKQKIVDEINDGPLKFTGHDRVIEGIRSFYKKLYSSHENDIIQTEDKDFFNLCPKLATKNKDLMDKDITTEEMYKALLTCKDSSPGPDGIPYSVYKTFWPQVGGILKESWEYSIRIGETPESHKESVITILPKEGKDLNDIKNWRPITLSNCDAKIITKTLASRINLVLDTLIDPSQTAYVPGRSVMDNIRANTFIKDKCESNKINAILASLDARKAFDSVDHKYIEKILTEYGFGSNFKLFFRTLYKDLSAKILVNGYLSDKIKIERGVKQGDALSCAIFILCIDPLIRNLNNNDKIKPIVIKTKFKTLQRRHKASGFADDISVACMNDSESVNNIFAEYQRLTNLSGLTLNADKTEILNLNPLSVTKVFEVTYNYNKIRIASIASLKICGIYFCNDPETQHTYNVKEKIIKLRNKLKIWQSRHLTLEGKSLILKTFGISQLIYNMQCVHFTTDDLKQIERYIFNFLWGNKDLENSRARDRIKRSVMKNEYKEGGLNITDIECMDKSLKLRQYIRANYSNHIIKDIQNFCANRDGCENPLAQEFHTITNEETVCSIAQETLNIIVDYSRQEMFGESLQEEITSSFAITQIASTNVETFLKRKNRVFLSCIARPFLTEGLENYLDFVMDAEIEKDKNRLKRLESIISAFPKYFRNAANSFNENVNAQTNSLTHFVKEDSSWASLNEITTKELQWILKRALHRISSTDFHNKLNIRDNIIDPIRIRKVCRNPKIRNTYFRMIHNDFFTYSRMFKYNMTNSPKCPRCDQIETTNHLLWECFESQKIWRSYNNVLNKLQLTNHNISCYDDIYRIESIDILTLIKIRLVNEFIQIIRPTNWDNLRTNNIIMKLRNIEFHNSNSTNINKIIRRWEIFNALT
jgi:exonuclease III